MATMKELDARIKRLEATAIQEKCDHKRLTGQLDSDGYFGGAVCVNCGKAFGFKSGWQKFAKSAIKIYKALTS